MPTFHFHKLIRDKLKDEYVKMNQKAVYKNLSDEAFAAALRDKIIEEAKELPITSDKEGLITELADIQQAIHDLMAVRGVDAQDVEAKRADKFAKKGGFAGRNFVETLTLQEGDEWVEYYRASPDVFKEETD